MGIANGAFCGAPVGSIGISLGRATLNTSGTSSIVGDPKYPIIVTNINTTATVA